MWRASSVGQMQPWSVIRRVPWDLFIPRAQWACSQVQSIRQSTGDRLASSPPPRKHGPSVSNFALAVTHIPTRPLRKHRFIPAHRSRVQTVVAGKSVGNAIGAWRRSPHCQKAEGDENMLPSSLPGQDPTKRMASPTVGSSSQLN